MEGKRHEDVSVMDVAYKVLGTPVKSLLKHVIELSFSKRTLGGFYKKKIDQICSMK